MNTRKKPIVILCVITVIAAAILAAFFITKSSRSNRAEATYTSVLDIPSLYSNERRIKTIKNVESIEETYNEIGFPQKIVTVKDSCKLYYVPPVDWELEKSQELEGKFRLMKIEIFGKQVHFGTNKIGVGSTKAEIEEAFQTNYVIDSNKNIYISFSYDDNDIVDLITLSVYG